LLLFCEDEKFNRANYEQFVNNDTLMWAQPQMDQVYNPWWIIQFMGLLIITPIGPNQPTKEERRIVRWGLVHSKGKEKEKKHPPVAAAAAAVVVVSLLLLNNGAA